MALTFTVTAQAERLAQGGGSAPLPAPSTAPNAVETPFKRVRELPITFVTEDNSELGGGACVISVKRQSDNSLLMQLFVNSPGGPWAGYSLRIPAEKYPMQVTEWETPSPIPSVDSKASYDGSVFKIVLINRIKSPSQITVYELPIDSNLSSPRAMRLLNFEGDSLSTAKPLPSRLICDENMS